MLLQQSVFLSSSMAEHSAVNRVVVGSSPTWGAKEAAHGSERRSEAKISGDNSLRDPPVPIPNTEVKPQHADGTWLETARESRTSPDSRGSGAKAPLSIHTGKDGARAPN